MNFIDPLYVAHGLQYVSEVSRVAHLEGEAADRDAVLGRRDGCGKDVDLLVGDHFTNVAEQAVPVERLDLDADEEKFLLSGQSTPEPFKQRCFQCPNSGTPGSYVGLLGRESEVFVKVAKNLFIDLCKPFIELLGRRHGLVNYRRINSKQSGCITNLSAHFK